MDINHTRAMINAALSGVLDTIPTRVDPIFRLHVPLSCPGVADEVLHPESTWSDKEAYKHKAHELALAFRQNFREFEDMVSDDVKNAGPDARPVEEPALTV